MNELERRLAEALIDLLDGTCYAEDIVRATGLSLERATAILELRNQVLGVI